MREREAERGLNSAWRRVQSQGVEKSLVVQGRLISSAVRRYLSPNNCSQLNIGLSFACICLHLRSIVLPIESDQESTLNTLLTDR